MKKSKENRKVNKKGIMISLICFVIFIVIICCTAIGSETPTTSNASQDAPSNRETATNIYETEKYLTTFNGVKITFQKVVDPKAGVTTFNLLLKLENNSNKKVTVTLSDGYVNDTAVTFFSGLPVSVAAGKNAVGSFGFGYQNLGLNKIDEIKKIEFKITLIDENYKMESSETVSIEF